MPNENPALSPQLRADMTDVVSNQIFVFLDEFTRGLFPNHRTAEAQSVIAEGIASAIKRYQVASGTPICNSIALTLLETKD